MTLLNSTSLWLCGSIYVGLIAVVLRSMLSGGISLSGLVSDTESDTITSERIQLLAFTVATSVYIVISVAEPPYELPDIPPEVLAVFGASHIGYLGVKKDKLNKVLN